MCRGDWDRRSGSLVERLAVERADTGRESSTDLGAQARGIKWLPQKVTSYALCLVSKVL